MIRCHEDVLGIVRVDELREDGDLGARLCGVRGERVAHEPERKPSPPSEVQDAAPREPATHVDEHSVFGRKASERARELRLDALLAAQDCDAEA